MKVLVTGSSKGIGKAIAKKFLENNFTVYGIDILDSTINNENYIHIKSDIRSKDLIDIKDLDIIVNNAGIQDGNVIDVNLLGTINICDKYINDNLKSLIFISSSSAINGAEFPLYCASKGGVTSYMKNKAMYLAKNGTTVNSISPGGVITSLNEHILNDPKLYEAVKNETLLHKWATVDEIADLVYYLTVINKSITGQDILIDNGEMLKSNFIW